MHISRKMGGGNSKGADLDRYGQFFSAQEKKCLNKTFHIIAGYEDATFFSREEFQGYISRLKLSISKEVATGVFAALSGKEPRLVQFADFVQNVSAILKGSCSQKAAFLCKVCSRDPSKLNLQQLRALLLWFVRVLLTSECAKTVFPQSSFFSVSAESSQRMISFLMNPLKTGSASAEGSEVSAENCHDDTVTAASLEKWMNSMPLSVQIFENIFAFLFYHQVIIKGTSVPSDLLAFFGVELDPETGRVVPDKLLLPLKVQHPIYLVAFQSELLDQSSLMLLNSYIPHIFRGRYYPLFSSSKHGSSFSTFCKVLTGCAGPSMIVVRDTDGHVFGGFASTAWTFDPNFTGDSNCFLFRLYPEVGVYHSTGFNQHFMYLQQNAQTLPNGLGMGGQLDYFGLWLSADYGRGSCKAKPVCTTYSSPLLSAKEEFEIDLLELWGVGDPVIPEEQDDADGKTSILDKDKMAQHVLEMAGKKIHSEGLREPDD